jgi:hypothetical protein
MLAATSSTSAVRRPAVRLMAMNEYRPMTNAMMTVAATTLRPESTRAH